MTDPIIDRAQTRITLAKIIDVYGTLADRRETLAKTVEAIVRRLMRERDDAEGKLVRAQGVIGSSL